jgi:hypothetical protein
LEFDGRPAWEPGERENHRAHHAWQAPPPAYGGAEQQRPRIYEYEYVRKTATAPAALVINEKQAPVVRPILEMFASGRFGLISRCLEERGVLTRL